MLNGKSILITGGTGSLGKQLVKTVLAEYPNVNKIVVFSRNEEKQYQMLQETQNWEIDAIAKVKFIIGDVRDLNQLKKACKNIDIIIHAAALKHIDFAENNPLECIKTNIGGAENIIEVAQSMNIPKVIAISTDKACSPTSVYGASKLCADKLFIAANDENHKFSVIRYANFFGSTGSVAPFFEKEKHKNVLPITHLDSTRFTLTIPEAMQIALDVLKNSLGGEIFVPKLSSFKVVDLAKAIAPDAKLEVIGLRQGEKIHEEMLNKTEANHSIETEKYYIILPKNQESEAFKEHYKGKKLENDFSLSSNQALRSINFNKLLLKKDGKNSHLKEIKAEMFEI